MNTRFTESIVEQAALAWLESQDYAILHGPDIAPGEPFAERDDYGQVVLERRLRQALQRLNPQAPPDALDEAFRRLTRPDSASLVANNHAVHRYLVEGVPVEYQRADGSFRGDLIRVLDHHDHVKYPIWNSRRRRGLIALGIDETRLPKSSQISAAQYAASCDLLRTCLFLTSHFALLAKFILRLSKDEFCGSVPRKPVRNRPSTARLRARLSSAEASPKSGAGFGASSAERVISRWLLKYEVVFGRLLKE